MATLKQKRRGGHSLYELPVVRDHRRARLRQDDGAGEFRACISRWSSGRGSGALRGVGGTRNCDWWFTDEAVFLDTAGRYTTQDSDADADSAGWSEFLALLRKYRKRRPVNGVILTISAQDLMTQNHGGARSARGGGAPPAERAQSSELQIQLPVYLMVTKCDLIAGFTEYFDDLAQEGRAQVWGMTFPYDADGQGARRRRLPAEFDALVGAV